MTTAPAPLDHRIAIADGLGLHVREWPIEGASGPSVVCLPGLSRPLEDFTELAAFLSSDSGGGRRVVAISARGRGDSDRDPDPSRYDVRVESVDVLAVLDALGIARAVVIGTSRGGLQAMAISALRREALAGVVLNDVGPVIEAAGLARIRSYLSAPAPSDWPDATARMIRVFAESFPALTPEDFALIARRTWRDGPAGLETRHDPALAKVFDALDLEKPLPPLWPLFDALAGIPVMVVRAERSDLLTAETVAEMTARRPDMRTHVVAGQGHAPLLADAPTLTAVAAFLAAIAA